MKFKPVFFFALIASLSLLLSACEGVPTANWPALVSDGKLAYLTDGHFIYSVQPSDGKERTIATTDGSVPLRFPIKSDGNLVFYAPPALTSQGFMIAGNAAAENHLLYAVDPATSEIKWAFEQAKGLWLAGVAVTKDGIYAPAGDGKLYALDLDGKKRWEAKLSEHGLWSAPVTDGKLVYIATLGHDVIALDSQTGEQRWKVQLDNAVLSAPMLTADGMLYVGTLSGNLYALKAADGSQTWLTTLQGGIWSTPVVDVDGKTLYIGTVIKEAGKFYAINTSDGKFTWNPKDDDGAIIASPLVTADQVIYVTEKGHIKFLHKDGSANGPGAVIENGKIYTAPILLGDLILVAPMNAAFSLAAYDQKGVQQWTFIPVK